MLRLKVATLRELTLNVLDEGSHHVGEVTLKVLDGFLSRFNIKASCNYVQTNTSPTNRVMTILNLRLDGTYLHYFITVHINILKLLIICYDVPCGGH